MAHIQIWFLSVNLIRHQSFYPLRYHVTIANCGRIWEMVVNLLIRPRSYWNPGLFCSSSGTNMHFAAAEFLNPSLLRNCSKPLTFSSGHSLTSITRLSSRQDPPSLLLMDWTPSHLQPSCWHQRECKHSYLHLHDRSTPTVGIMSPGAASFSFDQVGTLYIGANGCGLLPLWARSHAARFRDGCRACLKNGASFGSPWTNKD